MVKPIEQCVMPVPSEEMEPQQKDEPFIKFFMNLAGKMGWRTHFLNAFSNLRIRLKFYSARF